MRTLTVCLLLVGSMSSACSGPGSGGDEADLGRARIAITKAPADVGCVRLTVAGTAKTVQRLLDVTPGESTVFTVAALPLGPATFSAEAFDEGCGALGSTTVATWDSDPVLATVTAAPPVNVDLVMHRSGQASVGIDFDDDGGAVEAGAPADYTLSISPPVVATTLGTLTHYSVSLASSRFVGPVTLAASGLPEGWTATFTPPTVDLASDASVTADLVVSVPTNTTSVGTAVPIEVDSNAAAGTRSATAALNVTNEYDIHWVQGTGTGPHNQPAAVTLKVGATLRVLDEDTTAQHEVHSSDSGQLGFPHQFMQMTAGQSYAGVLSGVGALNVYCHDHSSVVTSTLVTIEQ